MIVVKVNKEKYFIGSDLSISEGIYKKFLEIFKELHRYNMV